MFKNYLLLYKNMSFSNKPNVKNDYLVINNTINFNYNFFYKCLSKNKNLFFYFKFGNSFYYSFSKLNNLLFLNFFKVLNNIFKNSSNLLFLDSNYKNIIPFTNFLYGTKNISYEKSFFFIKKNNLTRNNYIYFYKLFLLKYNIKSIVVLDYNFFKKFFIMLLKLNVTIFSVLSGSDINPYCDFFFFSQLNNTDLLKFVLFNKITYIFFYYYNLRLLTLKLKFFKKAKNLIE